MDIISKPVVPYMVLCRVNSVVKLFQARRRLQSCVNDSFREPRIRYP